MCVCVSECVCVCVCVCIIMYVCVCVCVCVCVHAFLAKLLFPDYQSHHSLIQTTLLKAKGKLSQLLWPNRTLIDL